MNYILIALIVLSKNFILIQTKNLANKEFLNSINTQQLNSLVYLIKKLALIKNETSTTSTKQVELVKYLVKKDVRVFFKANSMTISPIAYAPTTKKTTKTTTSTITNNNNNNINNNIFPLISIEETNQTYVIIKVNKELLILVASVILLIFIVVIVLNNMSKCVNGSKNYYFRQYY
jgi:hypothetical protein